MLFWQASWVHAHETHTLYVVRRGWHIDVGFAVDEMTGPLRAVATQFADARYLFFGFGDRHYLQSKGRGASTMMEALWPGAGLLLVTALSGLPREAFGVPNVAAIDIETTAYTAAESQVWKAFTKIPSTGLPGPYEGSLYFESGLRYSAAHTCNTWAAEVVHEAYPAIRSKHVIFAGQLWHQLRRYIEPRSDVPGLRNDSPHND